MALYIIYVQGAIRLEAEKAPEAVEKVQQLGEQIWDQHGLRIAVSGIEKPVVGGKYLT
jgi:hypothetical protein